MKIIILISYIIINIFVQILYGDVLSFVLFLVNTFLFGKYLYDGHKFYLLHITYAYNYISYVLFALFNYLFEFNYSEKDILYQLKEGLFVLLLLYVVYMFLPRKKDHINLYSFCLKRNNTFIYLFVFGCFFITLLANVLGVSKMGGEDTNTVVVGFSGFIGIINYMRNIVIPILFVVILLMNLKYPVKIFIILLFWAVFDAFVQASRSGIIFSLLPMICYTFFSKVISSKYIIRYVCIVLFLGITMFPIITLLRNTTIDSKGISLSNITSVTDTRNLKENSTEFKSIFTRTFLNGNYAIKYKDYINYNKPFDNYMDKIILLQGSPKFTTIIVDNLGNIAHRHSSGTTPFHDALLTLGILGGCVFFIIFHLLLNILDIKNRDYPLLRTCLMFIYLKYILLNVSISIIFNTSLLIVIVLILLLCKKIDNLARVKVVNF